MPTYERQLDGLEQKARECRGEYYLREKLSEVNEQVNGLNGLYVLIKDFMPSGDRRGALLRRCTRLLHTIHQAQSENYKKAGEIMVVESYLATHGRLVT